MEIDRDYRLRDPQCKNLVTWTSVTEAINTGRSARPVLSRSTLAASRWVLRVWCLNDHVDGGISPDTPQLTLSFLLSGKTSTCLSSLS